MYDIISAEIDGWSTERPHHGVLTRRYCLVLIVGRRRRGEEREDFTSLGSGGKLGRPPTRRQDCSVYFIKRIHKPDSPLFLCTHRRRKKDRTCTSAANVSRYNNCYTRMVERQKDRLLIVVVQVIARDYTMSLLTGIEMRGWRAWHLACLVNDGEELRAHF